jgi:hypothetical protein
LALVNASKAAKENDTGTSSSDGKPIDKQLENAEDMLRLHHKFKIPHMNGEDEELQAARRMIENLVESLKKQSTT